MKEVQKKNIEWAIWISNFSVEMYGIAQTLSLVCMAVCLSLAFSYLFNLLEWEVKEHSMISMNKKRKYKNFAVYFKRVAAIFQHRLAICSKGDED